LLTLSEILGRRRGIFVLISASKGFRTRRFFGVGAASISSF
jgi:hypothetical protein